MASAATIRADRRERSPPDRLARPALRAEFFFDLASPFTYLAERVDRALDGAMWTPTRAYAALPGNADQRG